MTDAELHRRVNAGAKIAALGLFVLCAAIITDNYAVSALSGCLTAQGFWMMFCQPIRVWWF